MYGKCNNPYNPSSTGFPSSMFAGGWSGYVQCAGWPGTQYLVGDYNDKGKSLVSSCVWILRPARAC